MNKEKLKHDVIFLSAVILTAFFIWFGYGMINKGKANMVIVSQDGEVVSRYPLSEEKIAIITYGEHEYNLLHISDGSVHIMEADCPDQICVDHKPISQKGESIICLPHKLAVQISSEDMRSGEGGIDALTY